MALNFELLEKVQSFDLKIDDLAKTRKTGPQELAELAADYQREQLSFTQETQKLDKLKADLQSKRGQLADEADSIKKKQDRSADVRNQKEYQASLREIENSRMEMAILEEDMKLLQERLHKQEEVVQNAQTVFDGQKTEFQARETTLKEKLAHLESETVKLEKERGELAKGMPVDILTLYDRVRKRIKGPAILAIHGASCPNCYMAIPPQKYNEIIRMENVYACGTCQLLHYYRGG